MPELPEVEAARRAIEEHCLGKRIKKCVVAEDPKVIDGVSPRDFEAALAGKTIVAAHRKGKNMWLQLDSPPHPSFQFGMTGAIYIKGVAVTKYKRSAVKDSEEWPSKYSKLFVELDDGLEFSFTDKRRFAKVRLLDNPASMPPISDLGPDALLEPMTLDEFHSSLTKKKIGVKALLLEQSFISGIGNWMADEVLYQARIHPLQVASSMSKETCRTLLKCMKEVIEKALEVGADSNQFPSDWIFHSREKKPGKAFVDGKKIDFITAGGRTTAYVPELQKLSGSQAEGALSSKGDESVNEEDTKSRKSKTEKKSKTTRGKKPSAKRQLGGSDDENDEDEDQADTDDKTIKKARGARNAPARSKTEGSSGNEVQKKNGRAKRTSAQNKAKESDDDVDADGSHEDDDYKDQKLDKKTNKTQASAGAKAGSNQNRKPPKRKVK